MSGDGFDADDIARSLRGEVMKDRKSGRKLCDELLRADQSYTALEDWSAIVRALLEYQIKEADAARRKGRVVDKDTAIFMKKVVKHAIVDNALTSRKVFKLVIEHTLAVLLDEDFPQDYKSEYRYILGSLMDVKVAHSISISSLYKILQYIRASIADAAAVRDDRNQKILRNFCKAMMKDTANFCAYDDSVREISTRDIASGLLEHYNLLFELLDDSGLQMDLANMFAESGLYLIEHCGVNLVPLLFSHALEPLRIISCQLPKLSDVQKEHCLRFLLSYFSLATSCHYSRDIPLCGSDPLLLCLDSMSSTLLSDDYLGGLLAAAYNRVSASIRSGRDTFFNVFEDNHYRLGLEVVAAVCVISQLQPASDENSGSSSSEDAFSEFTESLSSDALHGSGSRKKMRTAAPDVACRCRRGVDYLLDRLQQSRFASEKGAMDASFAATDIFVTPSSTAPKFVVEGIFLVIYALARRHPTGDFLGGSNSETFGGCPAHVFKRVCGLVCLMKVKLREAIAANMDTQFIGNILLALNGLTTVSDAVMQSSRGSIAADEVAASTESGPFDVNALYKEWLDVLQTALASQKLQQSLATLKKNSFSECLLSLVSNVLAKNLLDPASKWSMEQMLWSLHPMLDPRLVDSAHFFSFLSTMVRDAQNDVSSNVCSKYKQYVEEGSGAHSKVAAQLVRTELEGSLLGSLYVALWLDLQLDSTAAGTPCVPLSTVKRMCAVFPSLFAAVLSSGSNAAPIGVTSDEDSEFASFLRMPAVMPADGTVGDLLTVESYSLAPAPPAAAPLPVGASTYRLCGISLELLSAVRGRLFAREMVGAEIRVGESGMHCSSWVPVCLLLAEAVICHLEVLADPMVCPVPSLELTSAVISAHLWDFVNEALNVVLSRIKFYKVSSISDFFELLVNQIKRIIALESPFESRIGTIDREVACELLNKVFAAMHIVAFRASGEMCDNRMDTDDSFAADFDNGSGKQRGAGAGTRLLRRSVSKELERALVAVARCVAMTSVCYATSNPLSSVFEQLGELADTSSASKVSIRVGFDIVAGIAEQVAQCRCSAVLFLLELSCFGDDWRELSLSAYLRIYSMSVALAAVPRPAGANFLADHTSRLAHIILWIPDNLREYQSGVHWRIRVLQLQGVCSLLESAPEALRDVDHKRKVREIFLAAMADPDLRVRLAVSSRLPALFALFSKPALVYNDLVATVDFAAGAGADFSSIVTLAIAVAHMGTARPPLLKTAIFDLLRLHALASGAPSHHVNFPHLLLRLLGLMAGALRYGSVQLLVAEFLPYAIERWVSSTQLPLERFPFLCLASEVRDYATFLRAHSSLVVPLIVIQEDGEASRRFELLRQVATATRGACRDEDIAAVMRESLYAILSLQVVLRSGRRAAAADQSVAFLKRQFMPKFLEDGWQHHSDVVQYAFTLLSYSSFSPLEQQATESAVGPAADAPRASIASTVLPSALEAIRVKAGFETVRELLLACNLLDLLAALRRRVLETRQENSVLALVESVRYLIVALGVPPCVSEASAKAASEAVVRALLSNLVAACRKSTSYLPEVTAALHELCPLLEQTLAAAGRGAGEDESKSSLANEFFADVFCLCKAARSHCFVEQGTLNRDSEDFLLGYFFQEARIGSKSVAQSSISRLEEVLGKVLGFSDFTGVPIPAFYLEAFPTHLAASISPHGSQRPDLPSLIETFVWFVSRVLSGEPLSLTIMWLQLVNLSSALQGASCKALWREHSDLMNSLVASLVGICSSAGAAVSYNRSFGRRAVLLLGLVGPPDLLCVDHSTLPSKPGNLLKASLCDINHLKVRFVLKIYGMLWDSPVYSREASFILRYFNNNGVYGDNFEGDLSTVPEISPYVCLKLLLPATRPLPFASSDSAWATGAWATAGKTYQSWLAGLVARLVLSCYGAGDSARRGVVTGSDKFVAPLARICSLRHDVAEVVFPLLVYDVINQHGPQSLACQLLSERFLEVLSADCSLRPATQLVCQTLVFVLKQKLTDFMTRCSSKKPKAREAVKTNYLAGWAVPFSYVLKIDLVYASEAAARSGCSCAAMLFLELANERNKTTSLPTTSAAKAERGASFLSSDLLMRILKDIHDPDAVYGVNLSTNLRLQANMYAHTGRWMEALSAYESLIISEPATHESSEGVALSLKALGCQSALRGYSSLHAASTDTGIQALCSEAAWRGGDDAELSLRLWSVGAPFGDGHPASAQTACDDRDSHVRYFNGQLSGALRDIRRCDSAAARLRVSQCADVIFPRIVQLMSEETAQSLVLELAKAQQLVEVFEVCDALAGSGAAGGGTAAMMTKWSQRLGGCQSSSLLGEQVLSFRLSLMHQLMHLRRLSAPQALSFMEQTLEIMKSKNAAHAVSPLVYKFKSLLTAYNPHLMASKTSPQRAAWHLYECMFLWRKGLADVAMLNIDELVISPLAASASGTLADGEASNTLSEAYRVKGEWMGHRRAATGTDIISAYLAPAQRAAVGPAQLIKAYTTLGDFNARLYQSTRARLSSPEWIQRTRVSSDRLGDYNRCLKIFSEKRGQKGVKEDELAALKRHISALKKEIEIDDKEHDSVEGSIGTSLLSAIHDYAKVLVASPEPDLDIVFKVVNLWLNNFDDAKVNSAVDELVESVSSFKFVPLTYQIFSRIGASGDSPSGDKQPRSKKSTAATSSNDFQKVLLRLVEKLCRQHPHHTLPQLFALANEGSVATYSGASQFKSNMSRDRIDAALGLVQKLRKTTGNDGIVATMKAMLDAYINLAGLSTSEIQKSNKTKDISFSDLPKSHNERPFNLTINSLSPRPAVLTLNEPLHSDCDYSDIVTVVQVLPTFSITDSGLSRPKIVKVRASDGNTYTELVKGGDDMRQDAVMEQVFEHVNRLLRQVEETRKRKLGIRTYKIVPTTPQSGVIQWVENTIAFGSYLTDRLRGAHPRYYPDDWTHSQCREHLKSGPKGAEQLDRYREICRHFHPAFRFFFYESYPDVTTWMSRRLCYTRSVATTSIVGYVMGIGDRHAHNILVDEVTAEVVHIDFGIAYEQGRGLGVPETVPFRLTRDMVDGFGLTECEGTFRKSSEEALRVLRDSWLQLLTIIEVVIHDPLYKWSLSPVQARNRQKSSEPDDDRAHSRDNNASKGSANNDNGNDNNNDNDPTSRFHATKSFSRDAAERTIMRMKNKLLGCEDLSGEALGVEGQVELLINEARSPENLCRLFEGWGPWL